MLGNTHKLIFIIIVLFIAIGIVWFLTGGIFYVTNQQDKEQNIVIEQYLIPKGWYIHSINDNTILTRFHELPDIGSTEIYAYGDHIIFSVGTFYGTFENIEEWDEIGWVFKDVALVHDWQKIKILQLEALRVLHKATGINGEHLTYFLFLEDKFITVSLYSQDISKYTNEFEKFVYRYVATLDN